MSLDLKYFNRFRWNDIILYEKFLILYGYPFRLLHIMVPISVGLCRLLMSARRIRFSESLEWTNHRRNDSATISNSRSEHFVFWQRNYYLEKSLWIKHFGISNVWQPGNVCTEALLVSQMLFAVYKDHAHHTIRPCTLFCSFSLCPSDAIFSPSVSLLLLFAFRLVRRMMLVLRTISDDFIRDDHHKSDEKLRKCGKTIARVCMFVCKKSNYSNIEWWWVHRQLNGLQTLSQITFSLK